MFLLLLLLYILPVWIFAYFPTQDGPSHAYNAFILRHLEDPEYVFDEYYEVRRFPIPNWASHASMLLLMQLVPPLIAEKTLVTGYIILMAASMLYLLNSVGESRTPLVFIGFPLIYNYPLIMGFYNFSLGSALMLLIVGYWWRHFESLNARKMSVLTFLLIVQYFCHPIPLLITLCSIGTMATLSLLFRSTGRKQFLLSLACMLPTIGLALYFIKTTLPTVDPALHGIVTREALSNWKPGRLWQYFVRNESLAYHSDSQIIFGKFVTGAFAILFLHTLFRDHFVRKEGRFSLRVRRKDLLLLLCVAFIVAYLWIPDDASDGALVKARLCLYPFLIIIPWLSWDVPKFARGIIGGALVILAMAYIAHASYYQKILSDDIEVYNSGQDAVERNKVLLPLAFDYIGKGWRIGIFRHTPAYYGYATGCINLANYEATTNHFPTIFKPDLHRPPLVMIRNRPSEINLAEYVADIDYVITWSLPPDSDPEARILEHYGLVRHNGNLRIFKRKTQAGEPP